MRGAWAAAGLLAATALGGCAEPPSALDPPTEDDDSLASDDDTEPPPEDCDDGSDNDLDGAVDCQDEDCALDPGCAQQCLSAGALRCGEVITASTADFLATDAVDAWACAGGDHTGPELGLTFDADADEVVTFRLTANADLDLVVLPAASPCDGSSCLAGGGTELDVPVEAGVAYRVIVDGRGGAEGGFTLGVDCAGAAAEDCGDGADNDGDGEVDCHDPDCAGAVSCQEEDCDDGADNDGNGAVDCLDADCALAVECLDEDCENGLDDDDDGLQDCDDPDCSLSPSCHPEECGDGVDDDGDGLADCADPDCASSPECGSEDCDDGVDDDVDGAADCADPDCAGSPDCDGGAPCTPDYELACNASDHWSTALPGATDAIDAYDCSPWSETGPEYAYRFVAPSTTAVTVSLTGMAVDLDLFVIEDAGGVCASDACLAYGDAEASFTAEAGRTYYVVVDGYLGASGSYTLDVACDSAPEACGNGTDDDGDGLVDCDDPDCAGDPECLGAGDCVPDIDITCGQYDLWSNDGAGSTDAIDSWPCSSWDESGPEYAYRFVPDRTGTAVASLSGMSADLDLVVLDGSAGACDPAACMGVVDSVGSFAVSAGDEYYLVVDGYQGAVSDYQLLVQCW